MTENKGLRSFRSYLTLTVGLPSPDRRLTVNAPNKLAQPNSDSLDVHAKELLDRLEWIETLPAKFIANKFMMRKHEFVLFVVKHYDKMTNSNLTSKLKSNRVNTLIYQIRGLINGR
jgi:hypothetical protein